MRSEKEMMELILGIAQKDDRIRAVYMNGSRTNKNAKKDIFQDYDIVYVVRENKPFYEDKDQILPSIAEPSDEDYRIKKPSQKEFTACCNEFWWCLKYVYALPKDAERMF